MQWDAALYQKQHDFVARYGASLLDLVPDDRTQRILDLGCGTGELTEALARRAALVISVDSSPQMLAAARRLYPQLRFALADGCALPWRAAFDVVFSNAVFHWIIDQSALLTSVRRALRPGGLLICEFGACGNVGQIQSAFSQALAQQGIAYRSPFFFPNCEEYRRLLEQSGYAVLQLEDYDRPTALQGGCWGLHRWMEQFFAGALRPLAPAPRAAVLAAVEDALRSSLWAGDHWVADYRRLRVVARTVEFD